MRLVELRTAEQRYLSSPLPPVDAWTPLLIERLSRVLGARMKQRVQISHAASDPLTVAANTHRAAPEIRWDAELDAMWVRARLGGNVHINMRCAALSRNLLRTLQHALAEVWLSSVHNKCLPEMLRLRIEICTGTDVVQQAVLTICFPETLSQMDCWAQRINAS